MPPRKMFSIVTAKLYLYRVYVSIPITVIYELFYFYKSSTDFGKDSSAIQFQTIKACNRDREQKEIIYKYVKETFEFKI